MDFNLYCLKKSWLSKFKTLISVFLFVTSIHAFLGLIPDAILAYSIGFENFYKTLLLRDLQKLTELGGSFSFLLYTNKILAPILQFYIFTLIISQCCDWSKEYQNFEEIKLDITNDKFDWKPFKQTVFFIAYGLVLKNSFNAIGITYWINKAVFQVLYQFPVLP